MKRGAISRVFVIKPNLLTMKPLRLLALVCLATAALLPADIQVTGSLSHANLTASSGVGPVSDQYENSLDGTEGVVLIGAQALTEVDGESYFTTLITFSLVASHRVESSTSGYLHVTGGNDCSLSYSHLDWHWEAVPEATPTTLLTSAIPGSSTAFDFEITSNSEPVTLFGSLSGSPVSSAVFLHRVNGDGGTTALYQATTPGQPFSFSSTLVPGTYRVSTRLETNANSGTSGSLDFDLAVGTPPVTPDPFVPGDYTDSHFFAEVTDSPRLTVVSPAILSEVSQGNGSTLVSLTASLTNSSPCPWETVYLTIPTTFAGGPDVSIQSPNDQLWFPAIASGATAAPESTASQIDVLVSDADLIAFRASILSGERFTSTGHELWVFNYPVQAVGADDALVAPFSDLVNTPPGQMVFTNDYRSEFPAGLILLEDPTDPLPLVRESTGPGLLNAGVGGNYSKSLLATAMPFLTDSADYQPVGNLTILTARTHPLTGRRMTLLDLVKHGTVTDTIEFPHPSGLDVTDGLRGSAVARNHPIHFNRVAITDDIELSGSLFFKPGKMGISFSKENGLITGFTTTGEFDAGYTLLLETKLPTDNSGAPLAEQETTLFSVPLFSIPLASGVTFTPTLSMDLGANVNATQALTIPVEAGLHVSFTTGMKGGIPFYEQEFEAEPPTLSPPALFQQIGASANAWIKPELHLLVGIGGVSSGPTFGARLSGNFNLTPAQSPWWTLEGDLEFFGGVEFGVIDPFDNDDFEEILTFVDEEKTLATTRVFEIASDDFSAPSNKSFPLPNNPGIRPAEGENTRWARVMSTGSTLGDDNRGFVFPVPGTTDLIAGGITDIARYASDGTLLQLLTPPSFTIINAVPEDDGGFTILGTGHALARYDSAGNRLWQTDFIPNAGTLTLLDLERRVNGSGQPEYILAGWSRQSGVNDAIALLKYDHTGSLLWSKTYHATPATNENTDTTANSVSLTASGDLLLTGITNANLAGTTDPNFNTSAKPFLMKASGNDGSVLWATALAAARGGRYEAALESPEGDIYAAGTCAITVLDDIPVTTISKFAADGSLLDSLLLGSSAGQGAIPPAYDQGPVPFDAESPFDVARAMVWKDGHLWIGGTIGAGVSGFNLTNGQGGFTARLSPTLAVDRFVLHDIGQYGESVVALADGGDGLLACGYTRSVLTWPDGDSQRAGRLVMKLPDEGLMRFHSFSTAAQPEQGIVNPVGGSHYIYPRTVAGSDVTTFATGTGSGTAASYPVAFTTGTLTLLPAPFPLQPLASAEPTSLYQLEEVPREVITDFESSLAWHQLDAGDDSDGDGMDLATEYYHGTDPGMPDAVTLEFLPHPQTGTPTPAFPVSPEAQAEGWAAPVERSDDLLEWQAAVNVFQENGFVYLDPFIIPATPTQFYRLTPASAPE